MPNHLLRYAVSTVVSFLFILPAVAQQDEIPITTSSKEARKLFLEGRKHAENIELVPAAKYFDQAIAKDPNFALAYFYRSTSGGGSAVFRTNLEKAAELAEKVSAGERHLILGVKANVDGDRAAYKQHLDELLKLHPRSPRANLQMGFFYAGEGDIEKAVQWYVKATEANPNYSSAYNMVGYGYKTLGKYKEAESAFKKYLELAPESPNPADSYAELLLKMGRFDESIEYYRKAYEKDQTFVNALRRIGVNYIHKGEYDKARSMLQEAIEKSPQVNTKLGALVDIVYSYVHQGDIPNALKATERYRKFAEKENPPSVIFSHLLAGWINGESGNTAQAQKDIDALKKVNKTIDQSDAARSATEVNVNILQTYVFMRGGNLEAAKKQAETCRMMIEKRNIPSETRNLHLLLGDLESEMGNYAKALDHLDKGPIDNPWVMFSKGQVYERMGDMTKAKEWYKKAANWNWTGLQYALVRPKALKKVM